MYKLTAPRIQGDMDKVVPTSDGRFAVQCFRSPGELVQRPTPQKKPNLGALIVRIGFWGPIIL